MRERNIAKLVGVGTQSSVDILFQELILRIKARVGTAHVQELDQNRFKIFWSDEFSFLLTSSDAYFEIAAERALDLDDFEKWEDFLRNFNSEIVESIKDKIGGVATFVG